MPVSVGWLQDGELGFSRGLLHDVSRGGLSVSYLSGRPKPGNGDTVIIVFRDGGGYATAMGRVITVTHDEVTQLHVTFDPPDQPAVAALAGRGPT